jgi:hypothetical protein
MSSSETLDLTRSLQRALRTLLIWGVLYGGLLILLVMLRPQSFPGDDALRLPSLIGAAVLTLASLAGGWVLWQKTRLEALKALPARKFGAKEREPGLTPRAQLLRKRILLTATCFEVPAFIGFALPLMGGRALIGAGVAFIGLSMLAVTWLMKQLPARVGEVLG